MTSSVTDIIEVKTQEESAPVITDDKIEFPPPLTPIGRLKRAATFYLTALPIIASYYALMACLLISSSKLTTNEIESLWDRQHRRGAKELAQVITNLKGFYVKSAQFISTRQDLFTKQYTDALQGFTDSLDPMYV